MISNATLQVIEREAKQFFEKMGAAGTVTARADEESGVFVDAILEEPQLFIGEKGQTLSEIQHLLKAIIRKKIPSPQQGETASRQAEHIFITLDINEYRKNKENYLRELANSTADEVALLKKPKELAPMTAAERRILHVELSERNDVVSESTGEEPERKVVIKPQ